MNLEVLVPILLAFLAYIGWGLGDTLSIKLFRKNNPGVITVNSGLGRILIWLFLLPFFYKTFGTITLLPLIYNLIAGLSSGLGYYLYGKAAQKTNPSLVAAISGGWGASSLIIALLFLNETINLNQWVSIFLIFLGLVLVTFNFGWFKKIVISKDKGIYYAFLAFLMWGICGAFLKIPAQSYGWYWTSLIMLVPYSFVILLDFAQTRANINPRVDNLKLMVAYVLLIAIADLGYNGGFQLGGDVAIIGTIAGSYATFSTYLTYKLFKEPLTKQQKIGIIVSLTGIVFTAYFSSTRV